MDTPVITIPTAGGNRRDRAGRPHEGRYLWLLEPGVKPGRPETEGRNIRYETRAYVMEKPQGSRYGWDNDPGA